LIAVGLVGHDSGFLAHCLDVRELRPVRPVLDLRMGRAQRADIDIELLGLSRPSDQA